MNLRVNTSSKVGSRNETPGVDGFDAVAFGPSLTKDEFQGLLTVLDGAESSCRVESGGLCLDFDLQGVRLTGLGDRGEDGIVISIEHVKAQSKSGAVTHADVVNVLLGAWDERGIEMFSGREGSLGADEASACAHGKPTGLRRINPSPELEALAAQAFYGMHPDLWEAMCDQGRPGWRSEGYAGVTLHDAAAWINMLPLERVEALRTRPSDVFRVDDVAEFQALERSMGDSAREAARVQAFCAMAEAVQSGRGELVRDHFDVVTDAVEVHRSAAPMLPMWSAFYPSNTPGIPAWPAREAFSVASAASRVGLFSAADHASRLWEIYKEADEGYRSTWSSLRSFGWEAFTPQMVADAREHPYHGVRRVAIEALTVCGASLLDRVDEFERPWILAAERNRMLDVWKRIQFGCLQCFQDQDESVRMHAADALVSLNVEYNGHAAKIYNEALGPAIQAFLQA